MQRGLLRIRAKSAMRHCRFNLAVCLALIFSCGAVVGQSSLQISQIGDNRGTYPGGRIPRLEKLEIEFQVENSVAQNFQLPYDASPPPGLSPGMGISVSALLTPDDWVTTFEQPAFYYQRFQDEVRNGREWFYPTDQFVWKVRFAPHQTGTWRYRLRAQDASGAVESGAFAVTVADSNERGFIRVSESDPRYFEHSDGTYFPALGYNMNFDGVSWRSPVIDNRENFRIMSENGIQLARIWLSQWAIYGSEWNPWNSQDPNQHSGYLPLTGITFAESYAESEVSMRVAAGHNRCMFIGLWKAPPAVKQNATYRVRIRYMTRNMGAANDSSKPHGFVAKTGGWLWSADESQRCYSSGTGQVVTGYQSSDTAGWQVLEGSLHSGNANFLPNFFLVMENISQGQAFVDYVWIEEEFGDGSYGPNIVSKPWMAHHMYFEQRNSYAFDKLLDLAKEYGVYLRAVIHEKNERIFNQIDHDGNPVPGAPSNNYFYGDFRQMTKVRWLQQAWWRYLQARWGHSTQIHSWELLNEGDPFNARHYVLADEFGAYIRGFAPNHHLVSTSTWHSFPRTDFWANSGYPNVDFADVHLYVPRDAGYAIRIDGENFAVAQAAEYPDTAGATQKLGNLVGAKRPQGAGKPVIRGETGFVVSGSEPPDPDLLADRDGIWLHNLVWGGISAGGLIESYWYEVGHIYRRPGDSIDLRFRFRSYFDFIREIPLNNGLYRGAEATVTSPQLRAWGQKDTANGAAHLWIQNAQHTWRNVLEGAVTPANGSVRLGGFTPGAVFSAEFWDTQSGAPLTTDTLSADGNGELTIQISDLQSDKAVRITAQAASPLPPTNLRIVSPGSR